MSAKTYLVTVGVVVLYFEGINTQTVERAEMNETDRKRVVDFLSGLSELLGRTGIDLDGDALYASGSGRYLGVMECSGGTLEFYINRDEDDEPLLRVKGGGEL